MRALVLAALAAVVTVAHAQPLLPTGVLFDDFGYASTEWTQTLLPDHEGASVSGSLYGLNEWVVSPFGRTEARRLWYRYAWQETNYVPPERLLEPIPDGIRFTTLPGEVIGDGCRDFRHERYDATPQQIVTGFSARRGTWASRVRLGELPDHELATMVHAFWLLGASVGYVRDGDREVRVTNEIDHEWNNRFLGERQTFEFVATGSDRGTLDGGRKAPMGSPDALPGVARGSDRLTDGSWACHYTRDGRSSTLPAAACSDLLQDESVLGDPDARQPVWATLLFHVADDGIRFSLVADVAGGTLEMVSSRLGPPTQLPLFALFSQHLNPGGNNWTCDGRGIVRQPVVFEVDWFLYAEDPALSYDAAQATVEAIRERGVARLATLPGARLERPDRPLVGYAGRWGYGERTSPLDVAVEAPRELAPGDTTTILALPPDRHGAFRYTWTVTTHHVTGRTSERTRYDAFALPFVFPRSADRVVIHVLVEEVDGDRWAERHDRVTAVERTVTIFRR